MNIALEQQRWYELSTIGFENFRFVDKGINSFFYPPEVIRKLPKLAGHGLDDYLQEFLVASGSDCRPKVLEIGFGNGSLLRYLDLHYDHKLNLAGYGHTRLNGPHPDSENYERDVQNAATFNQAMQYLIAEGIRLVDGNVICMSQVLGQEYADIIMSHLALYHSQFPAWEIIKEIYKTLKVGGVALIYFGDFGMRLIGADGGVSGSETLRDMLAEFLGCDVVLNDTQLAFRRVEGKSLDDMPIETVWGDRPNEVKIKE